MGEGVSPNLVALVTGAGSGIGRAVALRLASAGFRLALAGRRERELENTARDIALRDSEALTLVTDVTVEEQVGALFRSAVDRFGRIDVLFNNAGATSPAVTFDRLSLQEWDRIVAVNLTGAFLCAREAFRVMKDQHPQGGRIINNGSISAHVPRPNSAPYTATKHAITGLTKSLSLDGRPYKIACGQIDIGNAATEMTVRMASGVQQANGAIAPEPVMDVENVADAVLYMANLPLSANVQFMTVMATSMPLIGRG